MIPGGRAVFLLAAALAGGVCAEPERAADDRDGRVVVPVTPHPRAPDLSEERIAEALARARERLADAETPDPADLMRFPVDAAPLRAGRPERVRVRGLSGVLFAIGADEGSVAWLDANAAELRRRGAAGFLVSAGSRQTLRRMRARAAAHGLRLDPLPGAALAESFGARSYPFVAEPAP